jgi:hypothetical protein
MNLHAETRSTVRPVKGKVSYVTLYDPNGGLGAFTDVKGPITDANNSNLEWTGKLKKVSADGKRRTVRMTCTKAPALTKDGHLDTGVGDSGSLSITLTDGTTGTPCDPLDVGYTDDDPCP